MNPISEQELRRALEPLRPDPEAFRRAVERKLAEREAGEPHEASASIWRKAAAVLPLDLLEPSGLPGGVLAVALGKKAGAGGLLGALALPAVSLAMLALTFVGGLRAVMRTGAAGGAGAVSADEVVRSWWRAHAAHATVAIGLLALLAWTQPAEAVVVVLLVSMAVVAVLVTRMVRAGAASRATVGAFTAAFLGALLGLGLVLGELGPGFGRGIGTRLNTERIPGYWAPTAVFWGCQVCDVLGRWKRSWTIWEKLAGALLPTALVAVWLAVLNEGARPPGPERMARFVERAEYSQVQVVEWRRLGRVGAWLSEQGVPVSPVPSERAVAAAWGRRAGKNEPFDASLSLHALAGAARLDLLPEALWEAVAGDEDTRILLSPTGVMVSPTHSELRVRALAHAGLTETESDHLGALLRGAWPRPEEPRALEQMAAAVELADLFGRPLGDDLRSEVHRALWLHWTGSESGEPRPAPFTSEVAGPEARQLGDPLHLDATHAGLALIERFGLPEGIDLASVRRFLLRAASPSLVEALSPAAFPMLTTQGHRYDAAVALRELDALAEAPAVESARTGWQAERVLIATLLLVALCLFATLGAPQRPRPA